MMHNPCNQITLSTRALCNLAEVDFDGWARKVSEPGYELTGFDKRIMEKLLEINK